MLSADVRFEGFTATDWVRVLSLFRPRRSSGVPRDSSRPRGGVVAVHEGGKLKKLLHTDAGRLRLDDVQAVFPITAEDLAKRHDASWAALIQVGALGNILDRFGSRSRRGDDLTTQTLILLQLARDEVIAGRLEFWPRRLRGVPIPTAGVVRGTFDSICPPGKTALLGLFEGGELWTSIAIRRQTSGIDLILGPDEVRGDMGLLAGDWRRDHRHLSRAIEGRSGPVALGCYAEVGTVEKLVVDRDHGAWTRAIAVRDVILSPVPTAVAIPLGIDVGRAAFSALRALAERMDPIGVVEPTFRALLAKTGREKEVAAVLGFDPLDLLRRLLARDDEGARGR